MFCMECETKRASRTCVECRDNYCAKCFTEKHRKGTTNPFLFSVFICIVMNFSVFFYAVFSVFPYLTFFLFVLFSCISQRVLFLFSSLCCLHYHNFLVPDHVTTLLHPYRSHTHTNTHTPHSTPLRCSTLTSPYRLSSSSSSTDTDTDTDNPLHYSSPPLPSPH